MRVDRLAESRISRMERRRRSLFFRFCKLLGFVFFIISIGCFGLIVYADMIATKLVISIGVIMFILAIIFGLPLMYHKFKTSRRIIGLVFAVILSAMYIWISIYLLKTLDFFDLISSREAKSVEYVAVVEKDSGISSVKGWRGEIVGVSPSDKNGVQAQKKLRELVPCELERYGENATLARLLHEGELSGLFISDEIYSKIKKKDPEFESRTKIIGRYTIKPGETSQNPVNVSKESFNVYITGLDTDGPITNVSRSDVNMVVTVNPKARKILMTSIPRDYYIKVSGTDEYDKLTHTGLYGADATVKAAEHLMGIDINYYIKINYTTVKNLIDTLGGIEVSSDYAFNIAGPDVKNGERIYYKKGINEMNGEEALLFARERHAFSDGDLQRNKNQQAVLVGLIHKLTGSHKIVTKYLTLLDQLGDTIEMNLRSSDIRKLIKLETEVMSGWTIERQSITGDISPELMPCYSLGGDYASVVMQDKESIKKAVKKIEKTMKEGN